MFCVSPPHPTRSCPIQTEPGRRLLPSLFPSQQFLSSAFMHRTSTRHRAPRYGIASSRSFPPLTVERTCLFPLSLGLELTRVSLNQIENSSAWAAWTISEVTCCSWSWWSWCRARGFKLLAGVFHRRWVPHPEKPQRPVLLRQLTTPHPHGGAKFLVSKLRSCPSSPPFTCAFSCPCWHLHFKFLKVEKKVMKKTAHVHRTTPTFPEKRFTAKLQRLSFLGASSGLRRTSPPPPPHDKEGYK